MLRHTHRLAPAVKPPSRRARVESRRPGVVLLAIHEHVNQRVPHFARRGERSRVVPVAEHGAPAAESAVDRASDPDRDAAETAGQTFAAVRFDEEMDVIVLDGEVDNPEAPARGRGHRT